MAARPSYNTGRITSENTKTSWIGLRATACRDTLLAVRLDRPRECIGANWRPGTNNV